MTPRTLVGRKVRVAVWDDLKDVMPTEPVGTITHVANGDGDVELTVRLDGFRMAFYFGLDEVELIEEDLSSGFPDQPSSDIWLAP
jgi:hypothetical protein